MSLMMIAGLGMLLSQQAIAEKMGSPQMMLSSNSIGAIVVARLSSQLIARMTEEVAFL
jgi:hypothetical protein